MSDLKISQMPLVNQLADTDSVPVVQGTGPSAQSRRTTVGAMVQMAVEAIDGSSVPVVITTLPGNSLLLQPEHHGLTLVWQYDVPLPVIVPGGLPLGFTVALKQDSPGIAAGGQIVVSGAPGIPVRNRMGFNATAGNPSTIVLMPDPDGSSYSLEGDAGFASNFEAPVIQGNVSVVVDVDSEIGTPVTPFAVQRGAGQVAWSITGTAWTIDLTTGQPSVAEALEVGTYVETASASNLYGEDSALFTAEVIPAGYDPISVGAVAWFQPRRLNTRRIVDPIGDGTQAYSYILDVEERGPQLYASTDPYTYPLPTLVEAGQFAGLDTASHGAVLSRHIGSPATSDLFEDVGGIAIEMALEAINLSAVADVVTQRATGIITLFGIEFDTSGRIVVTTRRLQTDTPRIITTDVGLRLGSRHYLCVVIDYLTGDITVQIDDWVDVFPGTWSGGLGNTQPSVSGALTVGALDYTAFRYAELAFYTDPLPDLSVRTANRAFLQVTYDLAGTSIPGVPEAPPILSDAEVDITDAYLVGRRVWRVQAENINAGAVTYTLPLQVPSGYLQQDSVTGWITMAADADHVTDPLITVTTRADNLLGYDEATLVVNVGPATYDPAAFGAVFWTQFSNDACRTVIDQSGVPAVSQLRDLLGSTRSFGQNDSSPLPTVATDWEGWEVGTLTATNATMAGDTSMRDVTRNAAQVGAELVLSIASLAATRDVLRWVSGGAITRWKVDVLATGQVRVVTTRLDGESTRIFTTSMASIITAGARNYLFVNVDYETGLCTVDLNGVIESGTVLWDGGYGRTSDTRATETRLGRSTVASSAIIAEMAFYRDGGPVAAERAINRQVLQAKYALV
jgi:hypothetical protein